MPDNMEVQDKITEAVFSWQHWDSVKYKKSIWWHIIALVVLGGSIWLCVRYGNPLFAIFLGLFYLVILLHDARPAHMVDFVITPDGIKMGNIFHYYKDFDHFYVIYEEAGIKNLYLEFRNPLRGRLVAPLDGQNAVAIREYLLQFLTEDLDRDGEPISEALSRWFRL